MSEDDEKPPLDAALRLLVERQRRSLTSHPTPQELAAYHAGELPPEAEAKILDHLAVCRECSDLLLDLSGFADLKPPAGVPELTDEQVEEDWQALRAKMRKEEPAQTHPRPAEVVPIRPARPARWSLPWLPLAASLLAVIGFSFGLYKDWQLRQLTRPAWGYIVDEREAERGDGDRQSFSAKMPGTVRIVLNELDENYASYEAEIVRSDNGRKIVARLPLANLEREPVLSIPPGSLEPGKYSVELYGTKGEKRKSLGDASFEVTAP